MTNLFFGSNQKQAAEGTGMIGAFPSSAYSRVWSDPHKALWFYFYFVLSFIIIIIIIIINDNTIIITIITIVLFFIYFFVLFMKNE